MQISKKLLDELKKIMKEEYGVEYTDTEAHEAGTNLVGYFDLLIKMDYEQKQKEKLSKNTEKRGMENASNSKPNDRQNPRRGKQEKKT